MLAELGQLAAIVQRFERLRFDETPEEDDWTMNGRLAVADAPHEFADAYADGRQNYRSLAPGMIRAMALVHAHGVFEDHVSDLLRAVLLSYPHLIPTGPAISVESVIRKFSHESTLDQVSSLRTRYGLSRLPNQYDGWLDQFSVIRNCVVHNRSIANAKLEAVSRGFYITGSPICITRSIVLRAITVFRSAAQNIDQVTRDVFPNTECFK